jgi:hypothetical protein
MTDDAVSKINDLYAELLSRQPRGFATSSMGKFDAFREWFADTFQLGDWKDETYAVGSASTAHNFGSRWTQNNRIAGRNLPLAIAFLSVPKGKDVSSVVDQATNTNKKFVDGTRTTSFDNIILFAEQNGDNNLRAETLLSRPGNSLSSELKTAFPGIKIVEVEVVEAEKQSSTSTSPPSAAELTSQCFKDADTALAESGLETSSRLFERAILSLAAKPFLILSGLSGSGKTLLGLSVAKWLTEGGEQVEVVPVGADWTSTHNILGYADALDGSKYISTPTINLILRAIDNPEKPYFIILDEMNLSHVERYFSDFLSGMESGEPITLHGAENLLGNIPSQIRLPKNLLIIGTVNIDETTYMFSPKVIDRANVIEFFVEEEAMKEFLATGRVVSIDDLAGAGISHSPSILSAIEQNYTVSDLPATSRATIQDFLLSLFNVLDSARIPFGFRTASEIIRYLVLSHKSGADDAAVYHGLDSQIAQRILSRLSGDAASLWPAISGILAVISCENVLAGTVIDANSFAERRKEYQNASSAVLQDVAIREQNNFPISMKKLRRVMERLDANGYVTAFEA